MNLGQLCHAVQTQMITHEMYASALELIKNPKKEDEQYTLQEYTTILYVLGAYKDVKNLSVYCGLKIDEVCKKKYQRISNENTQLYSNVEKFRLEILERVNKVLKMIDKRFININLIMTFILYIILMILLQQNFIITSLVALASFIINYFVVLPKSKQRFINSQMAMMKDELIEELNAFETSIY